MVSAIDATITFSSLFLSSDSMLLETLVSLAIVPPSIRSFFASLRVLKIFQRISASTLNCCRRSFEKPDFITNLPTTRFAGNGRCLITILGNENVRFFLTLRSDFVVMSFYVDRDFDANSCIVSHLARPSESRGRSSSVPAIQCCTGSLPL